jgi:hypothetical protein
MDIRSLKPANVFQQTEYVHSISDDDIAIVCYGHLRSFLYALPKTLLAISGIGNPHIFMHTWASLDYAENNDSTIKNLHNTIKSVCQGYNFVSLQIDRQPLPNTSHPQQYMYYSMWSANQLKKNLENRLLARYKKCIKIRPDIFISQQICDLNLNLNKNFYLSDVGSRHADIVAIGSSRTIDLICSFISRIDFDAACQDMQLKHFEYLSGTLSLEKAPLTYGKDWLILRVNYSSED